MTKKPRIKFAKGSLDAVPEEDRDGLLIRAMEDRADNEEVDARLRAMKQKGEKPVPWEQVKRELGL